MTQLQKPFSLKHFVNVEDLNITEVMALIKRAYAFKHEKIVPQFAQDYFVSNLFFENSTRTHKSFEIAERKLGLDVIQFESATSSISKGESLYDTVLTLSALGIDICVIRHFEEAYYKPLIQSQTIHCSIINGGDGCGQHPSQCLLDLFTIYEEFGHFKDLRIAIIGDLLHSRVANSNMQLLRHLGAKIYFSGPEKWHSKQLDTFGTYVPIDELVPKMDVLMLLRVQHERHNAADFFSKEAYHAQYGLTRERADRMQKQAIIMHPAPVNRNVELADELVESTQSRIVTQMTNGVFMRMAILEAIIHGRQG